MEQMKKMLYLLYFLCLSCVAQHHVDPYTRFDGGVITPPPINADLILETDFSQWPSGTLMTEALFESQSFNSDITIQLDYKFENNAVVTARGDHLEVMMPANLCCYNDNRVRMRWNIPDVAEGIDESWVYVSYEFNMADPGIGGKFGLSMIGGAPGGAFTSPETDGSTTSIWMWHEQGQDVTRDDSDTGSLPNNTGDPLQLELKSFRYNATSRVGGASRQFLKDLGTTQRILFDQGVVYEFIIHYKLNDPGVFNGQSEIWYRERGTTAWTKVQDIQNKNFRGSFDVPITKIEIECFPGGNTSDYESPTDRYVSIYDMLITSDSVAFPIPAPDLENIHVDFEGATIPSFNDYPNNILRGSGDDLVIVSNAESVSGSESARTRVLLSDHDPTAGNSDTPRAEWHLEGPDWKRQPDLETWTYKWKMFIPSDYVADPEEEANMQLKTIPDVCDTEGISTSVVFYQSDGEIDVLVEWEQGNDDGCVTSGSEVGQVRYNNVIDLVNNTNQWHSFTMVVTKDWQGNNGGKVEVYWRPDVNEPTLADQVVSYTGRVGYDNVFGDYLKLGSYKFTWDTNQARVDNSRNAGVLERDYWFDDLHVYKGDAGPTS